MLTALELYGFKSFPDRTRFEFPPGITVVVGPNGSGKSNIVDGIKWVLGEQSAKSLRGKEMADVIFKGTSGTGGRRPSNTAEATIFLDNSDHRIRLDADEIRITRRVYRSGEGEYSINGEPCRLKDIRNLIRGTGVGADAYSLIEQGKVDQMLQSSPKERRLMFEEAAGISRFKAKKTEAERRLARVEQNLVRLADIVEEVGNRYRKIRAQASKAAKYKEFTDRLRSLRTYVGAKDWRDFSKHLDEICQQKQQLQQQCTDRQLALDQFEESSGELDAQLATWSNQLLSGQESRNALVEQISQSQSNVALHQSRSDDLQIQSNGQRQLLERTSERLQQIEVRRQQSVEQLAAARQTCAEAKQRLIQTDLDIDQARNQIKQLRDDNQRQHDEKDKTTGLISELEKEISAANSQSGMTAKSKNRLTTVCNELDATIAQQTAAHKQHENEQKRLEEVATEKDSALKDARSRLQEKRDALANAQKQLAEERRAQTGASQRAEVIQELENKLEGVDTGVKELLNQAQADPSDALKDIVGLVADLIKVNVQHAELVDLALGDYAHSLVVDGNQLITEILTGKRKLGGRVRIIQLRHPPTLGAASKLDLHHNEGVVGRLDQLVQADSEFAEFTSSLLGGTWLVKTMRDAIHLRRQHSRSVRFVTLQGDVLEADGTLVAGPRSAVVGIVSRRSELRSLNREITRLQAKIDHEKSQIQSLSRETRELEEQAERLLNDHTEIASQLTNERALAKSVESRLGQLNKQRTESGIELDETTKALASFESQLATDRANLSERQNQLEIIVAAIAKNDHALDQLQLQQADKQKLQTTLKVNLAKAEQQHVDLENAYRQLDEQLAESQTTIRQTRDALAQMLWHGRSSKREVRESSNLLVELEYEKSVADAKINELTQQRSATENRRRELAGQINAARDDIRNWKDSLHDIELKEKQLSLERQQLAERLRDDYQIDISTLEQESQEVDENRDAIDKEISDLRRAIGNIGSVNMDALIELEEMQERYETLDAQYQDLVNSKLALEKIIQKINNDSRRLFAETLEAIRLNFQKLFRQTFGGGRADLVMDEDVDILEAGIDIVATPPGKPQFNNSLLSGGERALTAVSLLMAIFQFRPSPFCVLDEVDAPFDDANIGRFIEVLRSFLDWSKFVIVTHSKITMTAATTLYGVTMQESGVSKRVSVRFEDVNEEGEISKDALDRQSESDDQRTVA